MGRMRWLALKKKYLKFAPRGVNSGDPPKRSKMQKNIYFVILSLDKYLIVHKTKQNVILYLANTLMMKNIRQHPGGGLTLYVITRGAIGVHFFIMGLLALKTNISI